MAPRVTCEGVFTTKPSAVKPQPKQKSLFHHRDTEFTEFRVFFVRNSLLGVLSASAVRYPNSSSPQRPKVRRGEAMFNGE